jgi:hypothetical protein
MILKILGLFFILLGILTYLLKEKSTDINIRFYGKGLSDEKVDELRRMFNARAIWISFFVIIAGIIFFFINTK